MATKNATYKVYNGTSWDDIYFKTSASQVGESTTLKFLRPAANTVNGHQFFDNSGNPIGITIALRDIDWINGQIDLEEGLTYLNDDVTNILSAYVKSISSNSTTDKITLTWTKQDGSTESVDIPKSISDATGTTSGLMSAEDKSHLDAMYNVWGAAEDTDTLVNTVSEVLKAFENFSEGSNIAALLASKANASDVADMNSNLGRSITDLEQTVNGLSSSKANASDVYTKTQVDGFISPITDFMDVFNNSPYRRIYEGSTTPSGMKTGDIWLNY